MKIILAAALATGLALLSTSEAASQAATPAVVVDDPEATVVAELIVSPPTPGPAWWRVSKGDSVVWIFGLPAARTPKGMAWDKRPLERRLTGANALLMPPSGTVSFTANEKVPIAKMLPGLRWTNGNVEKAMPPALAARFAQARTRLKKPVSRYASPIPALAGIILSGDYYKAARLEQTGQRTTEEMAKRLRVPVTRPQKISMGQFSFADVDLNRPDAAACFDALLDSTEVPVERYRVAAAGWARGDLRTAISAPRDPFSICENRLFSKGYTRGSIQVQTDAIKAALERPGKTVAAVQLRLLLAEGGVLERLAADGYEIVSPAGLEEDD